MQRLRALGYREARTLFRSTKGWVGSLCYIAAGSAPALAVAVRQPGLPFSVGAGTVATETFALLPWLAAIYAFFLTVDAVEDDRTAGAWYSLRVPSLSNVGYLFQRAAVFGLILLPVAAIPVLVAYGVAWRAEGSLPMLSPFLVPFALRVGPILASFTALGLGAGVLGRGFLGGTVVAVAALAAADAATDWCLRRPSLSPSACLAWLGTREAAWLLERLRSLIAAVLLLHGASLGAIHSRSAEFHRQASEIHAARSEIRATTPEGVEPERLTLRGSIDARGGIETEVLAELVHRGGGPATRLAFVLNRHLRLTTAQAADARRLEIQRRDERLLVSLGKPLRPGEHLELAPGPTAPRPAR